MSSGSVFHNGEIAVQLRAGERAIAERRESGIRDRLNEPARAFVESQGVVAVGTAAPDGAVWASVLCGAKGFVRANADGDHIEVSPAFGDDFAVDPVLSIVRPHGPLGLLLIDLDTRRRLRINGVVSRVNDSGFELGIREAFGNCPKYIQRRLRSANSHSPNNATKSVQRGSHLDDARRRLIARSDTLFVTSVHPERGIDVSHRGGPPGFARVLDDHTLRIPDYAGNSMFQTLGNFEVDSRAGIAFIDFDAGRILSATGNAVAEFGAEDTLQPTGGTGRYWTFTVERWVELSLPASMTWTLLEPSPFNPN